jgi:M6 family metalloprotease-like protein
MKAISIVKTNLVLFAAVVFVTTSVLAAPFAKKIPFTQPDGTKIELWGEGDEFYAVFETLDGYAVVFDPQTKAYHYAQRSADGNDLISAGVEVGKRAPAALGLAKHLRIKPETAKKRALERFQRWDQAMQVSTRWKTMKNERRQAEAVMEEQGDSNGLLFSPPSSTTTGTKVGLCLLIDFSDDQATIPQADIINFCNGDDYTDYDNNGSVKKYYLDNSNNLLTYTNVVTIYIRAPQPKTYYNNTSNDAGVQGRLLITNAIAVMKALPNYNTEILPTFGPLTVDGSNNVVAFNVFYAGDNGGVWAKGLWPHSSSLASPLELSAGGKKVYHYQLTNIGSSLEIGTFCHENGHMLCGFPDIYDYDYDSWGGAGFFCLMDYGCYGGNNGSNPVQICAYLKRAAGWANVTDLNSMSNLTATVTAAPTAGYNNYYRYRKPGVSTEYFLVENRQQTGHDASIPAAGIAIWHIDELGNSNNQSLAPNTTHANYEVTLVQADNLWHFEYYQNLYDSEDLYYAGNSASAYSNRFDDNSSPNAHWWDGTSSGIKFRNFSVSETSMTFVFSGSPIAQPVNASTIANTPVSITLAATDDGSPNPPGVLSYIITSLPGHGALSDPCAGSINTVPYTLAGNGNHVIYTPAAGYGGADNFTFKANDGGVPPFGGDSNIETVSITIRFVIIATAGPNGSISPSGVVVRSIGDSSLFTATSNIGHFIDKWYLDSNVAQTGGNTYTLTNITANHTVYVTFGALPQYTITAAAGQNGHISPAGTVMVYQGDDKMFTATANPGYVIGTWFVDGNVVQGAGSTYTLHNIQANHNVLVTFSQPSVALYVDANSPNDPGTGKQGDPFRRLQDAINAVQDINTEVWVVAGIYKPTTNSDRTISFTMKPNVAVYGGFAGTETQRQQRNWVAHPTILSGDIGIADNNSDNSFNVVVGDINSILDGFTITGGNANDSDGLCLYGGGIYNQAGDMTIANCKITGNSAIVGGGVYNVGGNPKITNCTFSENAASEGGGMYNSWANPAIVNCSFVKNSAVNGGGIYDLGGNPAVVNCVLVQNSAGSGGGIYDFESNPAVVNCVLIQNSADNGGSIFELYSGPTISNCTFNGNISANGAVLACDSPDQSYPSTVTIANCIIWNGSGWLWDNDTSTTSIYYSDVNAGWPGTGNMNADPLFMGTDDFRLQANSPCIDAGNNNLVPADITDIDDDGNTTEPIPFDIAGNPRIADGNGDGVAVVDMGAYERCGPRADFNGDCIVNFADFAIMGQEWLTSGIKADIYKDGNNRVDLMDLAMLAEEWLK